MPEQARLQFAANQPAGRMGTAVEVASAIVWLLADEASSVTGLVHTVDGGATLVSPPRGGPDDRRRA